MEGSELQVRRAMPSFRLCYRSLSIRASALWFRCDAIGHVNLDAMSHAERIAYFYARTLVGRDFAAPTVHAFRARAAVVLKEGIAMT
jgi:hypothetical protein